MRLNIRKADFPVYVDWIFELPFETGYVTFQSCELTHEPNGQLVPNIVLEIQHASLIETEFHKYPALIVIELINLSDAIIDLPSDD